MPWCEITRQWDDGSVLVTKVGSDLDSLAEVIAAAAELDATVAPDD
jgi:hypothetical protein